MLFSLLAVASALVDFRSDAELTEPLEGFEVNGMRDDDEPEEDEIGEDVDLSFGETGGVSYQYCTTASVRYINGKQSAQMRHQLTSNYGLNQCAAQCRQRCAKYFAVQNPWRETGYQIVSSGWPRPEKYNYNCRGYEGHCFYHNRMKCYCFDEEPNSHGGKVDDEQCSNERLDCPHNKPGMCGGRSCGNCWAKSDEHGNPLGGYNRAAVYLTGVASTCTTPSPTPPPCVDDFSKQECRKIKRKALQAGRSRCGWKGEEFCRLTCGECTPPTTTTTTTTTTTLDPACSKAAKKKCDKLKKKFFKKYSMGTSCVSKGCRKKQGKQINKINGKCGGCPGFPLSLESRRNGDVMLTTNGGTPEYFLDGKWYPICGHWFWNNNHGAEALCHKLGYTSGTMRATRTKYKKNAVKVGQCNAGEAIDSCSAGCNERNANSGGCAQCQAGQGVGVTVTCSGRTGSFLDLSDE